MCMDQKGGYFEYLRKIKEETCFEGEYLHKYVKLSEKFDSHHDFMQAMSDGAFKDVLDEKRKGMMRYNFASIF